MFDSLYLLEDHSESQSRFAKSVMATIAMLGISMTALLGAERMAINPVEPPEMSKHLMILANLPMMPEAKTEKPPELDNDKTKGSGPSTPAKSDPPPKRERDVESVTTPTTERTETPERRPPIPKPNGNPIPGIDIKNTGYNRGTGDGDGDPDGDGPGGPSGKSKPLPPMELPPTQLKCISCPDPSKTEMRRAARGNMRSGRNITRFCTDAVGRVKSARTTKSSGDPHVDAVVTRTVKKWRLRPFKIKGKPRRACTTATFNIQVK